MVDPAALPRWHSVFLASNDQHAKDRVGDLLRSFGWRDVIDLGDLSACRAMEQLIPLWMRLEATLGGPNFNLAVVRQWRLGTKPVCDRCPSRLVCRANRAWLWPLNRTTARPRGDSADMPHSLTMRCGSVSILL